MKCSVKNEQTTSTMRGLAVRAWYFSLHARVCYDSFVKQTILRAIVVTGLLLFVPLIAMQFTDEVQWTPFDFLVMGGLLFITNILLGIIAEKVRSRRASVILSVFVFGVFLLIWAELAVGLFS